MSTPSSSSSSSIYPWKYDIFLSFSGEETRKTFTDHLYGALTQHRINPFRDVDNLERGEEIAPGLLRAIEESWGSIVVFSKGYAFSNWCLIELAKILEQRKARGHQVFPIFYHVEPSHLRKQSDFVQEAFAKYEERFKENKEKIQTWRDALSEVANISGWPLDDQYERNFIEYVVKEIFSKLSETRPHLKELHSKQNIGQVLRPTELFGEAPKVCMETILDYLMDDKTGTIALWGMPGSGKTLIMKHINDKLINEAEKFKFKNVIWVTVPKTMDRTELQNNIAGAIIGPKVRKRKYMGWAKNEYLFEDDETRRAGKLSQMLVRQGKFVLILDDLQDKLSLEDVGIPEPSNGSKLLVTARFLDLCRSLGCEAIQIRPLSKPGAWNLFSKKVGRAVLNYPDSQLLPIVKSVAGRCGGLPLAIVTIASSMNGELNISVWRNALRELRSPGPSVGRKKEELFRQLHFSYDRLPTEQLKHCFLYCAFFPEVYGVHADQLIELWIAEGLLEELDSRQDEIDQGSSILNILKSYCLLDVSDDIVRVHDLMRDMALRIIEEGHPFLVRPGMQFSEIPDVQKWNEDLEKVSLMGNRKLQISSQMPPPKCPKLTTLLLSSCNIESIPECFFEQMPRLRILDLSFNPIRSLPESISNLETLTTLLLYSCQFLIKVPSLSKLQALEKLDLRETFIWDLPHGMERLVNLKYLDLKDADITEIAEGLVTKYTSLQHLALPERGIFMRGEEIGGLRKLEFFEGRLYDLNEWNRYIQLVVDFPIERPREYRIFVGHEESYDLDWEPKLIEFNGCDITCSTTGSFKVLSDVEHLTFYRCIVNVCEGEAFFSQLNLVGKNFFSSLSVICIAGCKNIKKLFSSNWELQKNLQNLSFLRVDDCEDMEEIVASKSGSEEGEGKSAIKLSLPKLQELNLVCLPNLKTICSEVLICDSIESIYIKDCPKLKRIPLNLPLHVDGQTHPHPSLKRICIDTKKWWDLVEWDQLNAKSLLEPYVKYW